jgi:hypothetical protein
MSKPQPGADPPKPAVRPSRVTVVRLVNTTTLAVTTVLVTALEPKLPVFKGD